MTFKNTSWKDNYCSRCCWCPHQNPHSQLPGLLAARGLELPPSPGNRLHPSDVAFLGTTWEPVLSLWGQPSANGNWVIQKNGSLASLEPWRVQSSQWGEVEDGLQLNPPLCLAFPPSLAYAPHLLLGLNRAVPSLYHLNNRAPPQAQDPQNPTTATMILQN